MSERTPHRVVVVGGGFGGLQAVMKLRRTAVKVTLVDRRNFHQPNSQIPRLAMNTRCRCRTEGMSNAPACSFVCGRSAANR
jgi:NADH dehydrogenase FAD-containing subunit